MSCLICDGNATRRVVRAPDFEYQCRPGEWSLVECTGCGHVFLDPLPAADEVPALYPPGYYTVNPGSPIYMEGAVVEAKMVKDAEQLRRRLGTRPIRSVVDIGGGNLTRLIKLREVFEREGGGPVTAACLDLQFDAAVREQAEAAGIRCVLGNVETDLAALTDGGQDLIVLRQLLEHLRDPRAALRQLHRKLSPHGGAGHRHAQPWRLGLPVVPASVLGWLPHPAALPFVRPGVAGPVVEGNRVRHPSPGLHTFNRLLDHQLPERAGPELAGPRSLPGRVPQPEEPARSGRLLRPRLDLVQARGADLEPICAGHPG
ncbi:MAG: class I SAM-dependent methyltransferase [Verrucomicrobia bacterium]|nr:class I SAM-dependent methyltransferase [Verrucomicrobiota bacterium]